METISDTSFVRVLAAASAAFLVLGGAATRAAAGEGESALSGSIGVGTFSLPGEEDDEVAGPVLGGVAGVTYERGFSEALSWRVELGAGGYGGGALDDDGGLSWSAHAAGGLVYRFDVLKYVPYGLLELGVSVVDGASVPDREIDPLVVIGGGLDVLQSRDLSWGIEGRLASFAGDTTLLSLSVRITRRWGYF